MSSFTPIRCVKGGLECCCLRIQMHQWSFICWRGQPMTGDQCMADRGQIDLTSVFLSLSNTGCLSHLVWQTQRCVLRVCVCVCVCLFFMLSFTKHWPWPRQTEVDRLHSTICHRPGKGEKDRSEETEGCILIVSPWEKQFDKNKPDSLSLGSDTKWWAVSLVLFFSLTCPLP